MPTPRIKTLLRWSHRILLTTNLILLTAILLLWPISHVKEWMIKYEPIFTSHQLYLSIGGGRILLNGAYDNSNPDAPFDWTAPTWESSDIDRDSHINRWSYLKWNQLVDPPIGYSRETNEYNWFGLTLCFYNRGFGYGAIAVPFSYLTLLLLIYPALTYRRYRKSRHLHPSRAFPLDPTPTPSKPGD